MTTVTIELSQADRGRIDALLQRLEQLLHAEPAPVASEPEAPANHITPTDSTPDITPAPCPLLAEFVFFVVEAFELFAGFLVTTEVVPP